MAKKIPNIRFKGFEGEWKEKQLKDAVSYHSTGVRACDAVNSGSYKLYDANGEIGKIDSVASTSPYVSIIKDGSGVGRVRLMSEMTNVLGTMGCITAKDDADINFIFSHLQTKDFNNHIISGAIPHVYFRDYGEDLLYAPPFNEQQKIGEFFQQLDELIGAKEQELEKLRQMKQALLDKMFPKDEEIAPSIRFKGFTEPWDNKRLVDYGIVSMCKRVMKYQTTKKGDVPFFKIGTFGGKADAYISRDLFMFLKRNFSYPQKGDILISAAGTLGRAVEFTGEDQYFQDSNIVWLNHNNRLYNPFLKILYSIVRWNSVEGSTLKRLYNGNILNTQVKVPSLAEQRIIGDFFRSQDEAINSSKEEIAKLRTIKHACLQQMFA